MIFIWTVLSLCGPASAQEFWTREALLADMFPTSDTFSEVELQMEGELRARAKKDLGYAPPKHTYTFHVASTGAHVDGYVLFDEQKGQHEPITFAVQLAPDGVVVRHEVVVYREKYGHEVRGERFRSQFVGKTASDPLVVGRDVKIVSGATISSRAMAVGVRRAAVLVNYVLEADP